MIAQRALGRHLCEPFSACVLVSAHYDIKPPSLSSHTSSVVLQRSAVMKHPLHHIAVVITGNITIWCEREKHIIWVTAGKAFIGPRVEDNYT